MTKKSGFDALDVARLVVRRVGGFMAAVKSHDRDLASQLQRAGHGVLLNIEEGRKRMGGDQRKLFQIACGSASEVRAVVEVVQAWGWVAHDEELDQLMDRLVAMLWRASRPKVPAT